MSEGELGVTEREYVKSRVAKYHNREERQELYSEIWMHQATQIRHMKALGKSSERVRKIHYNDKG